MAEKEYIEREVLFKSVRDKATTQFDWSEKIDLEEFEEVLNNIPAADVLEVQHGEWILEKEPNGKPYCFHCSVCDGDFHHIGIKSATDYCPNCGAKMNRKGELNVPEENIQR